MTEIPTIQRHIGEEIRQLNKAFECLYLEEDRSIEHCQVCAESAYKLRTSLDNLDLKLQEEIIKRVKTKV